MTHMITTDNINFIDIFSQKFPDIMLRKFCYIKITNAIPPIKLLFNYVQLIFLFDII